MAWAWRLYRGAEFCALEVGFETQAVAEDDARDRLADPMRGYTRADISHRGEICATIYPINNEPEKRE